MEERAFSQVSITIKSPGPMAIWKFQDKKWAQDVDDELGNYDFL